VNVTIVEVRKGRDGKFYPMVMPVPLADRQRARALAHGLVHRDGLTIRAAQRVMKEQYGLRRSVGIIAYDLRNFTCQRCRDVALEGERRDSRGRWASPVPPPEPAPEAAAVPERGRAIQWGGGRP
jgi:hypothetical protein